MTALFRLALSSLTNASCSARAEIAPIPSVSRVAKALSALMFVFSLLLLEMRIVEKKPVLFLNECDCSRFLSIFVLRRNDMLAVRVEI